MNAARLKQARLLLGLTQTGVVEELSRIGISITSAAISGYEKGRSSPSLRVLGGLARVYHRDLGFFMTSPATTVTWTGFRKNTTLPASGQKAIKARAEMLFAHYLELKQTLEPDENTTPWAEMTSEDSPEAMEAAAENFRGRFGLGLEPIPSLTGLLERNGSLMVELETPHDFDGLSGLVNDRIPSLVLRKGTPVDRRRFSIAHEIAHLAFGVTDEKLAHRFASALLAPCEAVFSEVGRTRTRIDIDELLILKERYGLSMQAWMMRCRDLGIITEACYSSFCMTASAVAGDAMNLVPAIRSKHLPDSARWCCGHRRRD